MSKADTLRIPDYLSHIVEAIERHHAQFAAAHPEVPWSVLYTMSNRISHGYFKVDLEIVWKTIHTDLNELHAQIRKLLEQLG